MQYKRDITDALNDTIDSMTFPVEVFSVVANGDGTQTITCNDIYHAQKGFVVSIVGVDYTIVSISHANESLTLSGEGIVNEGDGFYMYSPHFFHGTPIATNTEINQIANASEKTPMFWLWENFKTKNLSEFDPADREVEFDLYALTQMPDRPGMLQTDDLYADCIKPMKRLIEKLVKTIEGETQTYDIPESLEYDTENYAKFGIIARNKGADKSVMFDSLSGVGTKMKLRLFRKFECNKEIPDPDFGIGTMQVNGTFIVQ